MIPINDVAFNLRITVVGYEFLEAAAAGLVNFGGEHAQEVQGEILRIAQILDKKWRVFQSGVLKPGFESGLRLREAQINIEVDAPGLIALSLVATGAGSARQSLVLRFKDGDIDELFARQDGTGFFFKELFCRWLRRIASYEHQTGKD